MPPFAGLTIVCLIVCGCCWRKMAPISERLNDSCYGPRGRRFRLLCGAVLESRKVRGKGGYHPSFTAKIDKKEFHFARIFIDSLMRDFPQITTEVLKELMS